MTDRIRHVTITLDRDYRDDDAESILNAIKMIKGVSVVEPRVVDVPDLLAAARVASDIQIKLYDAIRNVFDDARGRKP